MKRVGTSLRRLADASSRTSTLPLEDLDTWVAPLPGTIEEVIVTFSGRALLVAPVSWGELPWDRTRFLARVLEKTAPLIGPRELMIDKRRRATVTRETWS